MEKNAVKIYSAKGSELLVQVQQYAKDMMTREDIVILIVAWGGSDLTKGDVVASTTRNFELYFDEVSYESLIESRPDIVEVCKERFCSELQAFHLTRFQEVVNRVGAVLKNGNEINLGRIERHANNGLRVGLNLIVTDCIFSAFTEEHLSDFGMILKMDNKLEVEPNRFLQSVLDGEIPAFKLPEDHWKPEILTNLIRGYLNNGKRFQQQ